VYVKRKILKKAQHITNMAAKNIKM